MSTVTRRALTAWRLDHGLTELGGKATSRRRFRPSAFAPRQLAPRLLAHRRSSRHHVTVLGVVQQWVQSDLTWLRLAPCDGPSWRSHPTRSRARACFRFGDISRGRVGIVAGRGEQPRGRRVVAWLRLSGSSCQLPRRGRVVMTASPKQQPCRQRRTRCSFWAEAPTARSLAAEFGKAVIQPPGRERPAGHRAHKANSQTARKSLG